MKFKINNQNWIIKEMSQEEIVEELNNKLIGASIGLLVGGAIIATVGVGAALCTGYAFATVGFLGGSAAQTFAIGAIAIDIFAITIAPIFGIEMDPIEGKK